MSDKCSGECIVPDLEKCTYPPCAEMAAVLRALAALAALAGSTNGRAE